MFFNMLNYGKEYDFCIFRGLTQLCLRLLAWDSTREIAIWFFFVTQYSQFFSSFILKTLTISDFFKFQPALIQIKNDEPQVIQQRSFVLAAGLENGCH